LRVVLLAVVALACAPGAAHAADPGATLGVYAGPGDTAGISSFNATLGRNVSRGHDFLDKTSWSSIADVRWMAQRWVAGGYSNRLVVSVPMLPDTVGDNGLASGASGDYNGNFRTLAQNLVQYGLGSAVLRLGHEFNGTWYKWGIGVPNGGALYAEYWREIVKTMRAVPGAHFKFDWAPNSDSSYVGGRQLQAADAWPGTDYVDYVGLDVYDESWADGAADPAVRWHEYMTGLNGLAWHAAFAASKGKQMTFPEWALADRNDGHGGGDSPYFIQKMHDWIATHNVAYHLYFNNDDPNAEYAIFGGHFPNAARTFVRLFGQNSGANGFDLGEFARLCIEHARISPRGRRLKLLATLTNRASGAARVELRAGGSKKAFSKKIRGGRVKVSRKLTRRQARKGTGVLTLSYGGNATTKPQTVRLTIGPRKAKLRLAVAPSLNDGRLTTFGTISRRARGGVLFQLKYDVDGQTVTRQYTAKIRKGRWRLTAPLSQAVRSEIANRRSAVQVYAVYVGSLSRRIGGQMKTYELLGPL
jgi:hypothetical protein